MTKTKILIVDDYPENIEALKGLIEAPDVEIHSALNADEALELLIHHDFGLALLDVQMPGTDGFALAKLIRGVKRFHHLPIIFVTAHVEDSSVMFQGYETGAVDLLFKPLDPLMVRSKVRVFAELSQQRVLLQEHVFELERLRIEAEAANIAKSQFLANMSHEIRTPLGAVLGFSELIARDQFAAGDEKDDCIEAVRRNGKILLRLIDDILDLSKIEANRLEFEKVDFELNEVLRDVESTLSFKAKDKGIDLRLIKPLQALPRFVSDPTRIKQVLLNIIGNAIKFSSKGSVIVEVSVETQAGSGPGRAENLKVLVKDEGVGLTPAQAERLFQPFAQADPSTRRNFGGSGLGLVISRQIARALDGDLRLVRSKPGEGSVFEIQIRMERSSKVSAEVVHIQAEALPPPEPLVDQSGKTILVVDDSSDNLTLVQMILRPLKAQLVFAENGMKAINEVKSQKFDLILMDIQMPGMDGHETTGEIRKLGYTGPLVALTAHAISTEHAKCRASGCDEVLTKPINKKELVATVTRLLLEPPVRMAFADQ